MTLPEINKILLIEDEPDIQTIVTISLETIGGYKVKSCSSGYEALEIIKEYNPDLILLDVMMPGMDGPTTLKAIHEMPEFSSLPVIFMTAKAQAQEIYNYTNTGAIDVIIKPFDPMTLSNTIKNIWEKHHG